MELYLKLYHNNRQGAQALCKHKPSGFSVQNKKASTSNVFSQKSIEQYQNKITKKPKLIPNAGKTLVALHKHM